MDSIEVPIVTLRPSCLDQAGGPGNIIECVDYYINLLLSHAPAELTAEYEPGGKSAIWTVRSLPDNKVLHTETIRSIWFRPCLARIALSYMKCSPYGGFSRTRLMVSENPYSAVFYLGNDGLPGNETA